LIAPGAPLPDFEEISLFWEHELNDFGGLAAPKAQKA
jgi:hypothetical protein